MPNLAATETSGAVRHRTRTLSFALFFLIVACGIVHIAIHLSADLGPVRESSVLPFVLLVVALLIALGFEFVNGFHGTANAVETVICTHSLDPHLAVVWSGLRNLFGVLVSSGAVAFGIVQLLPVELILPVGSGAGRRNARPAAGPIEFQSDTRRYRWTSVSIRTAPRTPRRGACSPTAGMPSRFR